LDELADACEKHLDVPRLLELAAATGAPSDSSRSPRQSRGLREASRLRLGIARDAAFHFYYADNLESLEEHGVELVPFSPLADARLPGDLDAVYYGGGYPELYAAQLAENGAMLADLRHFAASGKGLYAECGGLMYLGRGLTTRDGVRYPLAGVLPIETAMLEKLQTLGYAEVAWQADCLWGAAGETLRGHEFHYSEITTPADYGNGWQPACTVQRRRAAANRAGFANGRILAGYVHLHWASRPAAIEHFVDSVSNPETQE
jgi:cobyrinic acid a,c-diamide synthase